jgi:TetR/AcrR family transcriptional regulator, upper aerobic nicotinate degradation pathway regulator
MAKTQQPTRADGRKRSVRAVRGRPAGQVATRENILRAAVGVFAQTGFAGARVERISRAARSTDRMIYYYFGSKEKLFVAVLETIYQELGEAEAALDLTGLDSRQSLGMIIDFTWNHYRDHPEMLTLLNNENLLKGKHLARSRRVKDLSLPLISTLSKVIARGVKEGVLRADLAVQDLYIAICALGYFYLSNRFTLSAFLGADLMSPSSLGHWREVMQEIVLRYARAEPVVNNRSWPLRRGSGAHDANFEQEATV